ncbi:polymorphic toxin type 47 domain-containing protein [Pseudomonas grimontii]|uniref:Bacterial toxin 47 domain-containing protein n=2 Tax=Pseudomonas grimontii TaxID=129847 RepID=A0A5C5P4G4_9PSED|nr:hypothetical protein FIV39_26530 [Pseudomonas grimontii]
MQRIQIRVKTSMEVISKKRRVQSGPNKVAEVNIDDPILVPSKEGPKSPHIGYQPPGKRAGGGAKRGHIVVVN